MLRRGFTFSGAGMAIPFFALAQTMDLSASMTIDPPSASCSIGAATANVTFTNISRTGLEGAARVEQDPVTETVTGIPGVRATLGEFSMTGTDVATNYTVTFTWPGELAHQTTPSAKLTYRGRVAVRASALNSTFSYVVGPGGVKYNPANTRPIANPAGDTYYYRIGGELAGISGTTPLGVYTGTITVEVTC